MGSRAAIRVVVDNDIDDFDDDDEFFEELDDKNVDTPSLAHRQPWDAFFDAMVELHVDSNKSMLQAMAEDLRSIYSRMIGHRVASRQKSDVIDLEELEDEFYGT